MAEPDNRLIIQGRVAKCDQTRWSPAGVPITRFVLEHQSLRVEAGHERQARARVLVMAAGPLSRPAAALAPETLVRVTGFISRANNRQGENRLVLHAETIETVETTEE